MRKGVEGGVGCIWRRREGHIGEELLFFEEKRRGGREDDCTQKSCLQVAAEAAPKGVPPPSQVY